MNEKVYKKNVLIWVVFWEMWTSVQFSRSVVSDSLRPHESQHTRPPCPSPTPRVHSDLCPSSRWCHPAILSSVVPFSSCPHQHQSLFQWVNSSHEVAKVLVSALASFLAKKCELRTCKLFMMFKILIKNIQFNIFVATLCRKRTSK